MLFVLLPGVLEKIADLVGVSKKSIAQKARMNLNFRPGTQNS